MSDDYKIRLVNQFGKAAVQKAYSDVRTTPLYKIAVGYVGTPYENILLGENLENYVPLQRMSLEGKPIIAPLKLDGVQFPLEPMISIYGAKKIIDTDIDGRKGTYQETWRMDNYRVVIRGIIINDEDTEDAYPFEQVAQIRQLCEKMSAVKVDEHQLIADVWGIPYLQIRKWEFPEIIGMPNVAKYTIEATSDFLYQAELEFEITG